MSSLQPSYWNLQVESIALICKMETSRSPFVNHSPKTASFATRAWRPGLAEYALDLKPQQVANFTALLTLSAANHLTPTSLLSNFNYPAARHQFRKEWQTRLSQGATLQFPGKKLNESFQANKMYLHVFDRGLTMTPGALTYSNCWIRDSAFMIHALDKLGFHDQAREKLVHLLSRQEKDGYFVSQEGEWDSNGQVLWVMLEHYKLTRNLAFLREVYPASRAWRRMD